MKKRILVDTNVLLDVLLEREGFYYDALKIWANAELGKVDAGGGGTIAQYVANLGVDTVDCGVSVLSMHAPYEVIAKLDVYMAFKAFSAFYKR